MLIPSSEADTSPMAPSLSRRVNANSQLLVALASHDNKLIKKGEC